MSKIVFDLDGVFRDLISYLIERYKIEKPIDEWYWEHEQKDIYKLIKEDNYRALVNSKPTDYIMATCLYSQDIEIWTNQPEKWMPYTELWLNNYLRCYMNCKVRLMTSEEKEKNLYLEDAYIVEDYPYFKKYDRVILADRSYNQKVDCKYRVKHGRELLKVMERILYGNN